MSRILKLVAHLLMLNLSIAFSPIEQNVAWDRKEVRVCWGIEEHKHRSWVASEEDYDFLEYSDQHKKWIKDIITREYTLQTTGISFIGWDECNKSVTNADVILFRIEQQPPTGDGPFYEKGGLANVGQKGDEVSVRDGVSGLEHIEFIKVDQPLLNVMILNTRALYEKSMPEDKYLQLLALHEFGHTAGLRHQHIRMEDSKKDPNCRDFLGSMKNDKAYKSTLFAGAYDPNSVMNYCWVNILSTTTGLTFKAKKLEQKLNLIDQTLYESKPVKDKFEYKIRVGLSTQDKHALRCLYVYDRDFKKQNCNFREK